MQVEHAVGGALGAHPMERVTGRLTGCAIGGTRSTRRAMGCVMGGKRSMMCITGCAMGCAWGNDRSHRPCHGLYHRRYKSHGRCCGLCRELYLRRCTSHRMRHGLCHGLCMFCRTRHGVWSEPRAMPRAAQQAVSWAVPQVVHIFPDVSWAAPYRRYSFPWNVSPGCAIGCA